MKIIITRHAEDRIKERLGTRRDRLMKVAKKAWNSKEITPFVNWSEYTWAVKVYPRGKIEYRMFSGCLFVFDHFDDCASLITCIRPREISKNTG